MSHNANEATAGMLEILKHMRAGRSYTTLQLAVATNKKQTTVCTQLVKMLLRDLVEKTQSASAGGVGSTGARWMRTEEAPIHSPPITHWAHGTATRYRMGQRVAA